MAQGPDAVKQHRWLDLIQPWQRCQLTVREFCERHQVSEASFFSWRRVLRERGLLDELMLSKTAAETPAFVKLSTLDAEPAGSPIELVLSQRRRLRVRPGFDADMLLQLLRLLEEPSLSPGPGPPGIEGHGPGCGGLYTRSCHLFKPSRTARLFSAIPRSWNWMPYAGTISISESCSVGPHSRAG
jgi:transposase-like protein